MCNLHFPMMGRSLHLLLYNWMLKLLSPEYSIMMLHKRHSLYLYCNARDVIFRGLVLQALSSWHVLAATVKGSIS